MKLSNLLLDESYKLKLGDFGLAKELSSASRLAQTNLGTPYYMAPEIWASRPYGEGADMWALGCTVYALSWHGNLLVRTLWPLALLLVLFRLRSTKLVRLVPLRVRRLRERILPRATNRDLKRTVEHGR